MNKAVRNGVIILAALGLVFFLTQMQQNKLKSKSTRLFNGQPENIQKVLIQQGDDALELLKISTDTWAISGNDTLVMRENRIVNLFEKVLTVEKGTLVSKNPERWSVYAIDDSTGTHLGLIDASGNTIGYYVFGRSKTDYAHNYVRSEDENEVYLTSENIIYHLSTSEEFWGEVPQPDVPVDSTMAPTGMPISPGADSSVEMTLPGSSDVPAGTIEIPAEPVQDSETDSE